LEAGLVKYLVTLTYKGTDTYLLSAADEDEAFAMCRDVDPDEVDRELVERTIEEVEE
jgi:cAMP phosphodiesterase